MPSWVRRVPSQQVGLGEDFFRPGTLDVAERAAVAALYLYFVVNIVSDLIAHHNRFSIVLLTSESLVLVFMLVRRSTTNISCGPLDWVLGVAGTMLPLLVLPAANLVASQVLIILLMVAGTALQMTAKFSLRRSFGIVAANRGVKCDGPYSFVRHPMYAGYMLTQLGFLLGNFTSWNVAVYGICWGVQLARIRVEERLLINDRAYRLMVIRVPYRLFPGLF